MNLGERDALEAKRVRQRLEKASFTAPRANLLGVLTALSAVDKIAGRPAEFGSPGDAQGGTGLALGLAGRTASPLSAHVGLAARRTVSRVSRDPDRREGESDRDRTTFAPFANRTPPKSKRPDSEGRMRGGAPDLWPRGDDVKSDPERDIAREASAEVLSIDDMARLMAARLRSKRFF